MPSKLTTPTDVLDETAGLDPTLHNRAADLVDAYDAWQYGLSPSGVAAAAYYAATILEQESYTQSEVGELFGVSEVTVRNHYKDIVDANGGWAEA